MAGDDRPVVLIERLEKGPIVHVAEIEHQVERAHVLEQIDSRRRQRPRLVGAAAIPRARPRRADHAHAALVPPFHLGRFADRIAAFDEIHQSDLPFVPLRIFRQ